MRTSLRPLLFALPVLALAGCYTGPPQPMAAAPPPPPPDVSGAFVAPGMSSTPAYSGSSVAPAPVAAPGSAVRLSASDALALLANNTAIGLTDAGIPYDVYFANNGTARFREQMLVDGGTWRVLPDGTVCSRLPRVGQGTESCYLLSRYGDVILYHRADGLAMGSIRVVSGNPQNL